MEEILAWRVDHECDLYNSLKAKIYEENAIPAVIPSMVGTLEKASLGYFLTEKGVFHINTIIPSTGLELVSGGGTVGLEGGKADVSHPHRSSRPYRECLRRPPLPRDHSEGVCGGLPDKVKGSEV